MARLQLSARLRKLLWGVAALLALMLTVPHFMATGSGAYKLAVTTAHQSPRFKEMLGEPITETWFSEGKEVFGNPATADLLIPVQGRMRRGSLRVRAVKEGGRWRLTELKLELEQPNEQIDLLPTTSI